MVLDPFDLPMSRLYASLIGMRAEDARCYRTMAATLQAFHAKTRRELDAWNKRNAR